MIPPFIKIKHDDLPDVPGVYLMKDEHGKILYVGKAASLKRRVRQHFERPHSNVIEEMTRLVREIDYIEKGTALEALILEANLIKFYWPKYNTLQKDNKSFMYLVITKEDFPKPLLLRGTDIGDDAQKKYKAVFGPYTSARSLRAALDLIRKAFPWSTCEPTQKRPCFYQHLKLCAGVCVGGIDKKAYGKIIRDLIKFFEGKKDNLLKVYRKEMKQASKNQQFELAAQLRNKIFFLEHIKDVAILKREDDEVDRIKPGEVSVNIFGRVECYDISHISGTATVASMVVFENGAPAKAEYRKFHIKSHQDNNDVASMREVLMRRFRHQEWRKPDLVLIDGGLSQVHAVEEVLHLLDVQVPVVGIAKGRERKRNDIICSKVSLEICQECEKNVGLLAQVRDEAHRFAITFHRKTRSSKFLRGT